MVGPVALTWCGSRRTGTGCVACSAGRVNVWRHRSSLRVCRAACSALVAAVRGCSDTRECRLGGGVLAVDGVAPVRVGGSRCHGRLWPWPEHMSLSEPMGSPRVCSRVCRRLHRLRSVPRRRFVLLCAGSRIGVTMWCGVAGCRVSRLLTVSGCRRGWSWQGYVLTGGSFVRRMVLCWWRWRPRSRGSRGTRSNDGARTGISLELWGCRSMSRCVRVMGSLMGTRRRRSWCRRWRRIRRNGGGLQPDGCGTCRLVRRGCTGSVLQLRPPRSMWTHWLMLRCRPRCRRFTDWMVAVA